MGSAVSFDRPTAPLSKPRPVSPPPPSSTRSGVSATHDRRPAGIGNQVCEGSMNCFPVPSMRHSSQHPSPQLPLTASALPPQPCMFPPLEETSQDDDQGASASRQGQQLWTMKNRHPYTATAAAMIDNRDIIASVTMTTAEEQRNDRESPAVQALASPAAGRENVAPSVLAMPPSILLSPRSECVEKGAHHSNNCVAPVVSCLLGHHTNDGAAEAKQPRLSVTFSVTAEVVLGWKSSDDADNGRSEAPQHHCSVAVVSENCPHKAQRAKPRVKAQKKATELPKADHPVTT